VRHASVGPQCGASSYLPCRARDTLGAWHIGGRSHSAAAVGRVGTAKKGSPALARAWRGAATVGQEPLLRHYVGIALAGDGRQSRGQGWEKILGCMAPDTRS
jgi:hypothetical protein